MSEMIRCDKCKKLEYTDSRSDKDAMCEIRISYINGQSCLNLCKNCLRQFYTEFIRDMTPEEFDEEYGAVRDVKDS